MGTWEDFTDTVTGKKELPKAPTSLDQFGNVITGNLQGLGNTIKSAYGSSAYNPLTGGLATFADYFNQTDKKKQAENDAEEAHNREQTSIEGMDRQRAHQASFAADLKNNAFRDAGLLTDRVAANERSAMADKIKSAKDAAGSRGLIGGGRQQSEQARARAEAAANTATKQNQIEDLLGQQVMDAEDLSSQLGLAMGGVQQNMADQYYRMAVQNMQNRNQSYSDILGAGARAGGSYLGSQRSA